MSDAKCELCGEPMPSGEEVFKFHGYSGPCPKPPLPKQRVAWIEAAAKECADRVLVGEGEKAFAEIIERHYAKRGATVRENLTPDESAALERTKRFKPHDECPKGEEPGSGLGGSPRQSHHGTAVVLSPEDYHSLLAVRDAMLRLVPADDGEPITEEYLDTVMKRLQSCLLAEPPHKVWHADIGDGACLFFNFYGKREWSLRMVWMEGELRISRYFPAPLAVTTRGQLRALLRALGIKEQTNGN